MSTESPSTPSVATSNASRREGDGEFCRIVAMPVSVGELDCAEGRPLLLGGPRV